MGSPGVPEKAAEDFLRRKLWGVVVPETMAYEGITECPFWRAVANHAILAMFASISNCWTSAVSPMVRYTPYDMDDCGA